MSGHTRRAWWIAAVTLVAFAIFVPCVNNALRWVDRPFPGFFVLQNGIVVSIGRSEWVRPQDRRTHWTRLLSVAETPVSSGRQVQEYLRDSTVGKPIVYTFRQGTDIFRLALEVRRFRYDDFLELFAPMLVIGLLMVLAGAGIAVRRPDAPEVRALFMLCLSVGGTLITGPDQYSPGWFSLVFFLSLSSVPPALVHLTLTYPQHSRLLRHGILLYAGLYLPFLGLGAGLVAAMSEASLFLPLLYMVWFLIANAVLLYVGRLVLALIEGVRPARPVVLALAAVLSSSLLAVAIVLTYPLLQQPISPAWSFGPLLLLPALTGIAFLRFPLPEPSTPAAQSAT